MTYNPIIGSVTPPTQEEARAHGGSWWVQAGYESGHQNFHFHTVAEVVQFVHQCKVATATFIWRPYYRETGMLASWPSANKGTLIAVHDGTGSI